MTATDNLRIFSGSSHPALAAEIAEALGTPLGNLLLTRFSDGEIRVQVEESARGMDVFLVQPTSSPVNESLMELLILIDAFRRASAARITCVLPYYGYARQDKKIKPREPVSRCQPGGLPGPARATDPRLLPTPGRSPVRRTAHRQVPGGIRTRGT